MKILSRASEKEVEKEVEKASGFQILHFLLVVFTRYDGSERVNNHCCVQPVPLFFTSEMKIRN